MSNYPQKPEKNIPHSSLVCHASFLCELYRRCGTCGQQNYIFVCHLTGQQQDMKIAPQSFLLVAFEVITRFDIARTAVLAQAFSVWA